jgi:Flp pilus assembly protein TadB
VNPLQLAAAGGMIIAAGLVAGVVALRPGAPKLSLVMAQLNHGALIETTAFGTGQPAGGPVSWWKPLLPPPLVSLAQRYLGARSQDLFILGISRAELAGRKAALGLGGLVAPAVFIAVLLVAGVSVPVLLPAVASLGLGAAGWMIPSRQVGQRAARARVEFLAALTAFLSLVALERQARGSPTEALEEASRISGAWPFVMIHTELMRAELAGQPPWAGLRDLGGRVGLEQLTNLADIVAAAADGAAVFQTLLAEARNLRNAELTDQQAKAGVAGEQMSLPAIVLATGFIMLVLYPALTRF